MASTKLQATAKLFLDTKDAASDAKQFVSDLKRQLSSIESAADKFSVFKDLVAYIAEVDQKLAALKAKNSDAFNHMFDGLDANLRSAFDNALSQSKKIMDEFDALNSKIKQANDLKVDLKSAMKDVNQFKETERVNDLAKTESDALQLLSTYKELHKYINQTNIDKSSLEYYKQLIEYMRTAARLAGSYESYKEDGNYSINDPNARKDFVKFGKQAEEYIYQVTSKFANGIKQSIDNIIKSLETSISNIQIKIPNIEETIATSSGGADKQIQKNQELSNSYEELKVKVGEYKAAQDQLTQQMDAGEDTTDTENQIEELNKYFLALDKVGDKKKEITNILGDLEFDGDEKAVLKSLCDILQIKIPQGAEATKTAIGNIGDSSGQVVALQQNVSTLAGQLQTIWDESRKIGNQEIGFAVDVDGVAYFIESTDGIVKASDEASVAVQALNKNLTFLGHTHPDGGGYFSLNDYISAFNQKKSGIDSPSILIGKTISSILNLDGVSDDIISQVQNVLSKYSNDGLQGAGSHAVSPKTVSEIQKIFSDNGFPNALQIIDTSNGMESLAQALLNVSISAQSAQTPLQKLQSLIAYYSSNKLNSSNISVFNEEWAEFESGARSAAETFDMVMAKLGATDLEGKAFNISSKQQQDLSSPLKMMDSGVGGESAVAEFQQVGNAAQEASGKVNAFLALTNEIKNNTSFGSAEDNVEIGKYTERLEVAKAELDKLGAQGLLTADQLEQVNQAFEKSKSHLVGETSHYDSFYSSDYSHDYYDDYQVEQYKNETLQAENEKLKEQVAKQSQAASNLALYEDVDGQLALFDGLSQSAQQATDSAIELENTVKRVSTLDGQMSMFDQSSQIQKENENLQEQVKLEEQASSADKPRSTNDLDVIKQENNALREQKQLEDDINASSGTGTKKTKSKITPEQKWDKKLTVDALTKYQGELRGIINNKRLGFNILDTNLNTQQQEIVDSYKGIVVQIEKTIQAVKNGEQVELSSIQATIDALKEKINTYKEQNVVAEKVTKQSNKNYGASVEIRETARFNKLNEYATDPTGGYSTSTAFLDTFEKYKNAYDQLIAKRKEFANTSSLTDGDKIKFEELKKECSQYAQELEKAIKISEKIKQNSLMVSPLGEDFEDTASGRKAALTEFVQQMYDVGSASLTFKKNYNECTFAVKNSDGTFTQMTAQLDSFGRQIGVSAGETKKAAGAFSSFFNDLKQKARSLSTYLTYMVGFHAIVRQIRQGITYVKEIDSALTELKKVTNETGTEYDAFLQSMSQTASVVGSTVSELTTMAAEWARLGYSMEEAGKLAESTAILLNVSEFEDATTASEALISTMQAFQYTADESQHVVDILNEVGKLLPVDNYNG